MLVSFH